MNNSYKYFIIKTLILPGVAIALIVAFFISVPSYYLLDQVDVEEQKLNRLERQYRALYSEVRFLMDQYALFKEYGDQFYDLEARGLVAGVKRLQWIDSILLFSYAYRFKNMNAILLPQTVINKAHLGQYSVAPNIFYLNPVRFTASLPIDIDFLRFVSFIDKKISNFYFFKNCTFSDTRINDLYSVKPEKVGMFSLKGGAQHLNPVSVTCVFNVVTSKPRKRGEK